MPVTLLSPPFPHENFTAALVRCANGQRLENSIFQGVGSVLLFVAAGIAVNGTACSHGDSETAGWSQYCPADGHLSRSEHVPRKDQRRASPLAYSSLPRPARNAGFRARLSRGAITAGSAGRGTPRSSPEAAPSGKLRSGAEEHCSAQISSSCARVRRRSKEGGRPGGECCGAHRVPSRESCHTSEHCNRAQKELWRVLRKEEAKNDGGKEGVRSLIAAKVRVARCVQRYSKVRAHL